MLTFPALRGTGVPAWRAGFAHVNLTSPALGVPTTTAIDDSIDGGSVDAERR
ncbi:hypothetical protein [Alloactinosynnema sp. L-07]|uniref:hypothetical protein n=1 Tax=Alloactinosynnema sp. L-07 TaxID=1653480 RepID=UPI00065F0B17|nr:hypothetical protein [Alloactinosynnema sp. L-07]CRK57072.1 hypothetical protein [Alloactinosynnema sp. L-07]